VAQFLIPAGVIVLVAWLFVATRNSPRLDVAVVGSELGSYGTGDGARSGALGAGRRCSG
jgi:hypothetical protein